MISGIKKKKRLYIDMDGTLTEWRSFVLKVENYEQKEILLEKLNNLLLQPGYFISLEPHMNIVNAIRELCKEYDVYILSCVLPKEEEPNPSTEKREWLRTYLPEIDDDHIIFVPDGENKTKYIEGGIREGDVCLDDYTPKLVDFEEAGGIGVKVLNKVNESKGSWKGNTISIETPSHIIVRDLRNLLEGKVSRIQHKSPLKERQPVAEISVDTVIER